MAHLPTVYTKRLKLKISIFGKSTSGSPVFLEGIQPSLTMLQACQGLRVILCLFKTVSKRFSLQNPCTYEVTVVYHFLIQAATYAFPPTLASSHPLYSKLPTVALDLLNIMFCL